MYSFIFADFVTFDDVSKRKHVKHERPFQDSWANDYLFIEQKEKPLRLVSRNSLPFKSLQCKETL